MKQIDRTKEMGHSMGSMKQDEKYYIENPGAMMLEHPSMYPWIQPVIMLLGIWLIFSPVTLGYRSAAMTWSDIISGAVAIALATEGNFDRVIATDISSDALQVAESNAQRYSSSRTAALEFFQGPALDPVASARANVVVSNPPYIAFSELFTLDESVRDWEPSIALLAGDNGMAVISDIISGAPDVLFDGGLLALEVDSRRASVAAELAAATGRYRDISILPDLTGRDRFILAYKANDLYGNNTEN